MKDIPIFTGQFGVATLILREIPYKKYAYVMVRSVREGKMQAFLEECLGFCRIAGAEQVLATADESISCLPHAHDMLELRCKKEIIPPPWKPVTLESVTADNGEVFLRHYNALFYTIPNAATYTQMDLKRILEKEQAWLAIVGGEIAGIGEIADSELCAIGVLPEYRGLGMPLAQTLIARMSAPEITLRVSSVNHAALRLYQKLGFDRKEIVSRWYVLQGAKEE